MVKKIEGIETKPISEIEEIVRGYDVKELSKVFVPEEIIETSKGIFDDINLQSRRIWINGFNAHKELSKHKMFTLLDMEYCYNTATRRAVMQEAGLEANLGFKDYMSRYHNKSMWDVEIVDGKIKLI